MKQYMIEKDKTLSRNISELKYANIERKYIMIKMKYFKRMFNKSLRHHNKSYCRTWVG